MTVAAIVGILAGLIAGCCLAVLNSRQLLLVIYHLPFRFGRSYLALYDALANKYTFELLGGSKRFKSHQVFLRKHHELRMHVTDRFETLWGSYAVHIVRDYVIVVLVSLALFWSVWWAFIGPLLMVQVAALAYLRFKKDYNAGFVAATMLSILLARA